MANPSFVAKGTWGAGTTSFSPGIPAGMTAGCLMILNVHTANHAVTTPSGWTLVPGSPISTGTAGAAGGTRLTQFYRWWQSGDAAPTVAVSGGTVSNGIIVGYKDVDPTTPFDVALASQITTPASTTLTFPGVTTATAGAMLHLAAALDRDANSTAAVSGYTNANLTGITETHDQVVNTSVGGGIVVARATKTTAGATGNTTATLATGSIHCATTIALRPAPAVSHATTGALTGQGSAVAGSAQHRVPHPTSGALTGQGSAVAGSASRSAPSAVPVLISTTLWRQDTLGTNGSPGAKAITVPSDAQAVVIHAHFGTGMDAALSVSSDFAGTFTVLDRSGQNAGAIAHAAVTSTGAKNLTLSWSASLLEGPTVYISFIKNINPSDWVRATLNESTEASSGTISTSISSGTDDLILVSQDQDNGTPTLMSGCTSLGTTDDTYYSPTRLQSVNSPASGTTSLSGTANNFATMLAIAIKPGSAGPATHATTGSLTGQGAAVSGSAQHRAKHTTTGALPGKVAVIAGAANHYRAHATTGALPGKTATIAGSAQHRIPHPTTGALTGQGSSISGAAARSTGAVTHNTTGALTGQGAAVAGSARRYRTHATAGAIPGQAAAITGSAQHRAKHTATGALPGKTAVVSSTALRYRAHSTAGVLPGKTAVIAGAAQHKAKHATTGALTGQGSAVSGVALRYRAHSTTGALPGKTSTITGDASRSNGPTLHDTTGALTGQGAAVAGAARRYRAHATTGALPGQVATVAGAAQHRVKHGTTGALPGQTAIITGSGRRYRAHDASGTLPGKIAAISGVGQRYPSHLATGVLPGKVAVITGAARRYRTHDATGALPGQAAVLSGAVERIRLHGTTGALTGPGAALTAAANRGFALSTQFSEATIQALAEAVWSRQLPIGDTPALTYGTATLPSGDIEAIVRRVWAQALP